MPRDDGASDRRKRASSRTCMRVCLSCCIFLVRERLFSLVFSLMHSRCSPSCVSLLATRAADKRILQRLPSIQSPTQVHTMFECMTRPDHFLSALFSSSDAVFRSLISVIFQMTHMPGIERTTMRETMRDTHGECGKNAPASLVPLGLRRRDDSCCER